MLVNTFGAEMSWSPDFSTFLTTDNETSIFQNNCCITTISHDSSKVKFCVPHHRLCVCKMGHRHPPTRVLIVFFLQALQYRNTQCMFFINSSLFPKYIVQFQCKSSKVQVYQAKFSSGISQNEVIHSDYRS